MRARKSEVQTTLAPAFRSQARGTNSTSSIWSVARYETMTPVGLRAKGTMSRDLLALVGAMDGLSALQELIPARLRSPGISSPSREELARASRSVGLIGEILVRAKPS